MHDYLVVSAVLYGSIFAHEAKKYRKSVIVSENLLEDIVIWIRLLKLQYI